MFKHVWVTPGWESKKRKFSEKECCAAENPA